MDFNMENDDSSMAIEDPDRVTHRYLSPRRLKEITGTDDLESVTKLTMQVDSTETSLGNFGVFVPNLEELNLNDSVIPQCRALGSSLNQLKILWMSRCQVYDIDGISSISSLEELYLSFNEISDLDGFAMLEKLRILDLENNEISDINQIHYLAYLEKLTHLTLEGNPICVAPNSSSSAVNYNYRTEVCSIVSQVTSLDDILVTSNESMKSINNNDKKITSDTSNIDQTTIANISASMKTRNAEESQNEDLSNKQKTSNKMGENSTVNIKNIFEDDWHLIDQLVNETGFKLPNIEEEDEFFTSRPVTASGVRNRPKTAFIKPVRPVTALARISTSSQKERQLLTSLNHSSNFDTNRPNSKINISPTYFRPSSATSNSSSSSVDEFSTLVDDESNSGSILTKGTTVCGLPARVLKKRHNEHFSPGNSVVVSPETPIETPDSGLGDSNGRERKDIWENPVADENFSENNLINEHDKISSTSHKNYYSSEVTEVSQHYNDSSRKKREPTPPLHKNSSKHRYKGRKFSETASQKQLLNS